MKNSKVTILMTLATLAAVSTACGKNTMAAKTTATTSNASSAEETVSNPEDVLANDPVTNFVGDENAKYSLVLSAEPHDITEYVVSYKDGICLVKSSILTDFFGFTKSDRSNDELVEYTNDDGKILQLPMGSNDIIFDGADHKIGGIVEKIDGSDDVTISMDFLLCIGIYDSYSTSVQSNALTFEPIVNMPVEYETVEDSQVETDAEGTPILYSSDVSAEALEEVESENTETDIIDDFIANESVEENTQQ